MNALAYVPLAPSRSHGEEIAAALFFAAIERAKCLPVMPLRVPSEVSLDGAPVIAQPAQR